MFASLQGAFFSIPTILRRPAGPLPLLLVGGMVFASGLSARPVEAATTVSVTWNSNAETNVTGYLVSWGTKSGTYTTHVDVGNQTSFQFTEPDATVPYYFSVRAYNSSGLYSSYSSEVASVPPVIVGPPVAVTGAASAITATGATLNGTGNPKGAATTGYFAYGLTASYGSSTTPMNLAWGTVPVSIGNGTVTGLTCKTTYHFRATATNTLATTSGTDATFTTAACPMPLPTAVTTAASGILETAAKLNGTATPNGSATTSLFQYGPTIAYGSITPSASAGSGTVSAAMANGSLTGLNCNTVYHFRATATNATGTATGADAAFTTAACVASPSGTRVPAASSITDTSQGVWTLGSGAEILRNGQATGGWGSQILWFQGTIYVFANDNNWWKWTGSLYTLHSATDPSVIVPASPSGTKVPAAASITDNSQAVWTIGSGAQILRNGQATGGWGSQILWFQSNIYVFANDNNWWKWTGTLYTLNGATDPSVIGTASPSGTKVPAVSSITDSSQGVWTLGSGAQILRNGQATGGWGSQILWFQGNIYVFANDNNWWKWTGTLYTLNGAADPSVIVTASPSGTKVPTAASITDNSQAVWTIGSGAQILRNGQATGGWGSQILWFQGTIYVYANDNNWWKWTGTAWVFFSASVPV